MSLYESVFIARQDVSGPQVETMADTFAEVIESNGGKVAKREHWGLKNLAFKIKKNRKGHYVMLNLDAPADAIQELERQMRLHEDVLRYLTLRVDDFDEGLSVQMQGRDRRDRDDGDRGDRGDRGGRRDESGADKPAAKADEAPAGKAEETADGAETKSAVTENASAKTEGEKE